MNYDQRSSIKMLIIIEHLKIFASENQRFHSLLKDTFKVTKINGRTRTLHFRRDYRLLLSVDGVDSWPIDGSLYARLAYRSRYNPQPSWDLGIVNML